jgi:hypothetical protein
MSDEELVKALRDAVNGEHDMTPHGADCLQAADRIEALIAERDEALNQLDSARHSVDVLEKRVAGLMSKLGEAQLIAGIALHAQKQLEVDLTAANARAAAAEAKLAKAGDAAVDAGASLAAAISLLERGGRKAAPSNKMFDQMLVDYRNSLERTRTTLAEIEGEET